LYFRTIKAWAVQCIPKRVSVQLARICPRILFNDWVLAAARAVHSIHIRQQQCCQRINNNHISNNSSTSQAKIIFSKAPSNRCPIRHCVRRPQVQIVMFDKEKHAKIA
jgi:hypothetical protein